MAFGPEQVANELSGFAKRIYDTGVIDQEQRLTRTWDELPTKNWNLKGAGWYGDAHFTRSSSFKFANPTESLPQETIEINQQFTILNAEMFGIVPFTKDFIIKLVGGVTSFEDYTYKIEDLLRSQKKNQNQSCYIGPTMLRATLTSSPSAATTFTVDTAQYLFNSEYIDIYNGANLVLSNVQITAITNLTITVAAALTATSGYTIYHHEENLGTTTGKGFNSIPFQCDDGTDFNVTFEGLSRVTFPGWRGNRIDAAGQTLTNDLLQKGQNTLLNVGGHDYMAEDYINLVNPDSVRRYISIVLPQKRYIDASKYDSGMEKPEMLEWNSKPIKVDPDTGKNDWIMYNRMHGGKMELAPLAVESMLGGTSMKWKSGFMQGVTVTYFSGNTGTNKCNANLIFRNLQAVN